MKHKIVMGLAFSSFFFVNAVSAMDFMTAEEVKSAFSGKTTEGHHAFKDRSSSSYLAPDGRLSGTGGSGKWRVDDEGRLCIYKDKKGKENCRHIVKDGDQYKKYKNEKKHVWTYTSLTEGNVKNFELAE